MSVASSRVACWLLCLPLSALAAPTLDVQWLERDADKLGKTWGSPPDGVPDHHFRIAMTFPVEEEVLEIELRNESEVTPATLRWNSIDESLDALVVEHDGRRLNDPPASLGLFTGTVVFDVYAHDFGQWDVHRPLIVTVQIPEGPELKHVAAITPPRDRLRGQWSMHCTASSPNAFEPMTLSGNVLLVLGADGTVGGFFGTAPVTGRHAADGRIEGRAKNAEEEVEWQGRLEAWRPGTTARGKGSFRLLRSRAACEGEGIWASR